MKRTFTNMITLVFLSFLLIGLIGVFQNIIQDIQKSFAHESNTNHILAYQKV